MSLLLFACSAPEPDLVAVSESLARSNNPPGGLSAAQVPQFVSVTFDDNFSSEGMTWATDFLRPLRNPSGSGRSGTFDGTPVRTSFYHNSLYLDGNRPSWQVATNDGNETADHTVNHPFGLNFDGSQWSPEVINCRDALHNALSTPITGFRTPYLGYNDALYGVLAAQGFAYDTSIESCWPDAENGTNCAWPYTLDASSVDAAAVVGKFGSAQARPVGPHAGLWEMPVTTVIVPPDGLAAQYGFTQGLRVRVGNALAGKSAPSFYDAATGKLGGLDITMIVDAGMNRAEALATLEYTLDLHLAGNRAPFIFVAHTHVYASGYGAAANVQNSADRRAIIEDFLHYALSKPEVRVRPVADVLAWMKAPVALGGGTCTPQCSGRVCGADGCGGSCGSCFGGQTCNASGQCVSTCTPQCSGRVCGADGCGGSCGTCGSGQTCNASGVCQSTCTPQCSGRGCGSDGCGGTCGSCGSGQTCNASGVCQSTGGGNCGAPAWTSQTYASGDVVTAPCAEPTVGTACYGHQGQLFAWRCEIPYWCEQLKPGSNQAGWWSGWSSLGACN